MTRSLFTGYTSAIAMLFATSDIPELRGDFDLSYVEFPQRMNTKDYTIRIAPLHVHILSRSRTTTVSIQQLEPLILLEENLDEEEPCYLAPLSQLFPNPPSFMAAKEIGYVQLVPSHYSRKDDDPARDIVRVSPIKLHLAGPFFTMRIHTQFEDEMVESILPIQTVPKKEHRCRYHK